MRSFEKIFRKSVESMDLNTTDPEDAAVADRLGIKTADTEGTNVIVLSAGGVVDSFQPPVSTKDLLGSFQKLLLSRSGCGGANEGGLKSSCDE